MGFVERIVADAPTAFQLLKGVFCIYKPAKSGLKRINHEIKLALCNDLNSMKQKPIKTLVKIKGSLEKDDFRVVTQPCLGDSPLVLGPRYQKEDIRLSVIYMAPFMSSGLGLLALSSNQRVLEALRRPMIRTYHLHCQFGLESDDYLTTGKILKHSSYKHISPGFLEKLLASIQANHQRQQFALAGLDMKSEEAFQQASKGLIRPNSSDTTPLIYDLRCIDFNAPSFTLEVQIINEIDSYLAVLVDEIGRKLRSAAAVEKIRLVRYGPFTLEHALVKNHWTLSNIVNNIQQCRPLVEELQYPSLMGRTDITTPNLTVLDST